MGYDIKVGQDITVRPHGKERGLKLFRNFGEDYTLTAINRRILTQAPPQRPRPDPVPSPPKRMPYRGTTHRPPRIVGFRALYVRYYYMLGGQRVAGPMLAHGAGREHRPLTTKQVHFFFREDIRKMHHITNEMKLLGRNRIDTAEQLVSFKEDRARQIADLTQQRQQLRNHARREQDAPAIATIKAEITALSKQLIVLRREVKLCGSIETRTAAMQAKIKMAAEIRVKEQAERLQGKELNTHDQWRRRG
jgi:hypothetical protein